MDFKDNSSSEDSHTIIAEISQNFFNKVFKTIPSADIPRDELPVVLERLNSGNTLIASCEYFLDGLKDLRTKLISRKIKLGDVIGVGVTGGITFNLLDEKGQKIESSVLRIDWAELVPPLTPYNPARIRPILQETAGNYAATIVPRAERAEFTDEELFKALAVINADKQLPHLKDLEPTQFRKIKGISLPVLTDLSCTNDIKGLSGKITEFLAYRKKTVADIEAIKIEPEMAQYRQEQEDVHNKAVAELTAAGINLGPVSTKQTGAVLSPLEQIAKVQER